MAFDQVSVFLYPRGWEQRSEATTALHYSGRPVRIVSAVRTASGEGPAVRVAELSAWLVPRGFEVVAEGRNGARFASPAVPSALGRRAEVEVSAGAEGGEVSCLYCRFLLTRQTPLRLERWEALVRDLCGAFAMRISVPAARRSARRSSWRSFAARTACRCLRSSSGGATRSGSGRPNQALP